MFISDGSNGVGDGDILIKLVGVDLTNAANDVITIVSNNLTGLICRLARYRGFSCKYDSFISSCGV